LCASITLIALAIPVWAANLSISSENPTLVEKYIMYLNFRSFGIIALLIGYCTMLEAQAKGKNEPTYFSIEKIPAAPDYGNTDHWSALPFRKDAADAVAKGVLLTDDAHKEVDVFYVYPTLYTKGSNWNADVFNDRLNKRIDNKPVHFQASVFNETCRVYAPRYRQSHVKVFFEDSTVDGQMALDLAYEDVKTAFEYYLKHYNNGRPMIIAGHSQGSWHTRKLLAEYFDTTALQQQLVAAYIIGYNIREDDYVNLSLCQSSDETGCFVSWMSYREGHIPQWDIAKGTQSVNPLSWTTDLDLVPALSNLGTVVLNLNKNKAGKTSARLVEWEQGTILYVKTKRPLLRLLRNLHVADYNLFYTNIRENVQERIRAYQDKGTQK
jgi:hypothetical protein